MKSIEFAKVFQQSLKIEGLILQSSVLILLESLVFLVELESVDVIMHLFELNLFQLLNFLFLYLQLLFERFVFFLQIISFHNTRLTSMRQVLLILTHNFTLRTPNLNPVQLGHEHLLHLLLALRLLAERALLNTFPVGLKAGVTHKLLTVAALDGV